MALDSKLLKRSLDRLGEKRQLRTAEYESRRAELYRKDPELKRIDSMLRTSVLELIEGAFGPNGGRFNASEIKAQNLELQAEYAERVRALGYPYDWLDYKPECQICGDRGFVRGGMCSCLRKLYREEQIAELAKTLKISEETFDAFDLGYYSDLKRENGLSEREQMELIYETCLRYARRFSRDTDNNLLLTGGTGLGKTFLSTCIARVVSEAGFYAVYDTAVNIFGAFEGEKFSRSAEETEEYREMTERYINCDLLIIDDLGTEMPSSFVTSAMYTLINSRLTEKRATIISTNLSVEELRRRYSAQACSRIEGNYRILVFCGQDIRLQKKNERK